MLLETDRLKIRPLRIDDVAAYTKLVADAEVMKYLGGPLHADSARAYILDCIERQAATGISRYAVSETATGDFLGFCGYKALTFDDQQSWLDFGWRYRRSSWRQGYGFEAAAAVYRYARQELHLSGIEARAHRDNTGSLRIIERLGFRWLEDYDTEHGPFRRFVEA